jgi:hypothetical protein
MDAPHWSDQYTTDELVVALKHHAAQLAHKYGLYEIADELRAAAECIDDLSGRIEAGAALAANLESIVVETQRKAKAALESLSKLP